MDFWLFYGFCSWEENMTAFLIYVKRCLRIKIFIAVLLFMPIISIVFNVFGKDIIGEVKFGVYAEGDFGKYICESLEKEKSFKFIKYDSVDKMNADVAVCEIDSGYVFDKNFENSVEKNNFNNVIKVISSDSSSGYGLANEIVFSKVLNIASPNIANDFLNEINVDGNAEKYYYDILKGINVFSFNFIEMGDNESENENVFELQNIFAVFVLIGSVFGAAVCAEDKRKNINKRCFFNVMAFSALLSASAVVSAAICGELGFFVLFKYISFAFASASFAYLFTFLKNIFFIYGSIPVITVSSFFVLILNITAGPFAVVFDVLKWILPVGLYCVGDIIGMVVYFCVIMVMTEIIGRVREIFIIIAIRKIFSVKK